MNMLEKVCAAMTQAVQSTPNLVQEYFYDSRIGVLKRSMPQGFSTLAQGDAHRRAEKEVGQSGLPQFCFYGSLQY